MVTVAIATALSAVPLACSGSNASIDGIEEPDAEVTPHVQTRIDASQSDTGSDAEQDAPIIDAAADTIPTADANADADADTDADAALPVDSGADVVDAGPDVVDAGQADADDGGCPGTQLRCGATCVDTTSSTARLV